LPFVRRDQDGRINAVSDTQAPSFDEAVEPGTPELTRFLAQMTAQDDLANTDLAFVRVLEDLLDVLIDKNVLLFTELPEEAQKKIMARQALRKRDNALNILQDEQP